MSKIKFLQEVVFLLAYHFGSLRTFLAPTFFELDRLVFSRIFNS